MTSPTVRYYESEDVPEGFDGRRRFSGTSDAVLDELDRLFPERDTLASQSVTVGGKEVAYIYRKGDTFEVHLND